jgi:hypothetical protein
MSTMTINRNNPAAQENFNPDRRVSGIVIEAQAHRVASGGHPGAQGSKGGFLLWRAKFLEQVRAHPSVKAVHFMVCYALLHDYVNRHSQPYSAFPGDAELARNVKVTVRTIYSVLKDLQAWGLIEIKPSGRNTKLIIPLLQENLGEPVQEPQHRPRSGVASALYGIRDQSK